jgi:hypothetical protein
MFFSKNMMLSLTERDSQTPRQLLPGFYKQYNLEDDGGQNSPYVRIEFTKNFALYFPNFAARRKAVFKHDVHHIATGYASTYKGETEIGAWEIASGCRQYWVAFVLDMSAFMTGLLFNPLGVYRAFVKGRRTRNLYTNNFTDEQIMDMPLSSIRESLKLNNYPENNMGNLFDLLLFLMLVLFGIVYSVLSILLLPFVLIYSLYIIVGHKAKSSLSE